MDKTSGRVRSVCRSGGGGVILGLCTVNVTDYWFGLLSHGIATSTDLTFQACGNVLCSLWTTFGIHIHVYRLSE